MNRCRNNPLKCILRPTIKTRYDTTTTTMSKNTKWCTYRYIRNVRHMTNIEKNGTRTR